MSRTYRTRPADANGNRIVREGDRYILIDSEGRRETLRLTRSW